MFFFFYILPPLPLPTLRPLERDLFFLICTYRGSPSVLCIAFFKLEAKNDRPKRIGGIYLQFNMSWHGLPLMSRLESSQKEIFVELLIIFSFIRAFIICPFAWNFKLSFLGLARETMISVFGHLCWISTMRVSRLWTQFCGVIVFGSFVKGWITTRSGLGGSL